ncbi:MAG: hypothetical protein M0Z75_03825 [Nitrospiraceae bacterium]|nr:hypothetical protein [Nitrospiraceae bacterium]
MTYRGKVIREVITGSGGVELPCDECPYKYCRTPCPIEERARKAHRRAISARHYEQHRQEYIDRATARNKANPEKRKAICKTYRQKHRLQAKAYKKRYRKQNKEKVAAQQRRWAERNPDKVKARWKRYYERHKDDLLRRKRERKKEKCGLATAKAA